MGTPASKCRFIIGLRLLKIGEPLGKGDQIQDDFLITNDKAVARNFMGMDFSAMLGRLEGNALLGAGAVIYCEGSIQEEFKDEASINLLTRLLAKIEWFQSALWMMKDNAINFELGYLEVRSPNGDYRVHSNFLGKVVAMADGIKKEVEFSRSELKLARKFFQESLLPLSVVDNEKAGKVKKTEWEQNYVMASDPTVPRLGRAFHFIAMARSCFDLGLKVAMYCSMYETLFSTDAAEVTHKICHRIAIFLENETNNRRDVFSSFKKIYGIRSKVVHGDEIRAELDKIQSISVDADEIARRIMRKIFSKPELMEQFHANKSDLDEYFLNESFGGANETTNQNLTPAHKN